MMALIKRSPDRDKIGIKVNTLSESAEWRG